MSNHQRWPFGYPEAARFTRATVFRVPGAGDRMRANVSRIRRSFEYLGLKQPKFGALFGPVGVGEEL